MLYVAALAIPAKKALGNKCQQVTIQKIIEQLTIDPVVSGMDAVLVGPQDLSGTNGMKFQKALANKNPGICVLYVYSKKIDSDRVSADYVTFMKKPNPDSITEFVNSSIEDFLKKSGAINVSAEEMIEEISGKSVSDQPQDEEEIVINDTDAQDIPKTYVEDEEVNADVNKAPVEMKIPEVESNLTSDEEKKAEKEIQQSVESRDENLANISNYHDWNLFKEALRQDSIVRGLVEQNTEYLGITQTLDMLDQQIQAVFMNQELSAESKFQKIKEIGLQRAELKGKSNAIATDRIIRIMDTICTSAERTVKEKIESVNKALYKITVDHKAMEDTGKIDDAVQKRASLEVDLLNMVKDLIEIYKAMDKLATDQVNELDSKLPSDNMIINQFVNPLSSDMFTATNCSDLANLLFRAVESNRIKFSMLEEQVNSIIGTLFSLCQADNQIIQQQQEYIRLLKSQRVEDVVILDSIIKNVLRIFTGADETGRTSTALIVSGIEARRHNVLVVDLSMKDTVYNYGVETTPLDEFLENRIEQQMLVVKATHSLNSEELRLMVKELKSRLNYYSYINVIVNPEDIETINQLSEDSLVVNYITNCTPRSIETMRECIAAHDVKNVARKLIMIDTPVNPLHVCESLGIDPMITKLVTIPNISNIRACQLQKESPWEYSDVIKIYEEAFRR